MSTAAPPNAEDVQKVVTERLQALKDQAGTQETVTVEWRGQQRAVPVISMPLELLSYNPGTHRVRAQRSLDPAKDLDLQNEPFGKSGQAYLHNLLMGDPTDPTKTDPSFEALKDDLKQHGQSDPGIISRTGVLINGNTRCAALKELGQQNIRVGVLPPDAGFEDLQSIELSLQLRKDHKRDYSFMNFLLAIDERVKAGWTPEKIQKEFRIKATTFERSRWILAVVQEIIDRSQVPGTNGEQLSMRLVDFESHQGKLEELQRAYSSLKSKSPDDAEALREQRIFAIALNKSKTDVRLIEHDFSDVYMKDVVPKAPASTATVKIPGTSITTDGPSERVQALRALTTDLLRAKAVVLAGGDAPPAAAAEAGEAIKELDTALEAGLVKAGREGRIGKKRYAPVERLSDANDDLQLTLAAIAEARATGNFDLEDLDETLLDLKNTFIKLAQIATRDVGTSTSEGIAWLRHAGGRSDEPTP